MPAIQTVIAGAAGRMGRVLVRAVAQTDGLAVSGALVHKDDAALGADAGQLAGLGPLGVRATDDWHEALAGAEAIVDFTAPELSLELAKWAGDKGLVHVIGTTGLDADADSQFENAARAGARIVKSGNMSLGVNLLAALVKKAAAALGPDYDAEIVEMHHNQKVDAPSGTALLLGEALAEGRAIDFASNAVLSREGHTGPRKKGTIGFATLRGGNVIGEHKVILAGPDERLELGHVASDRGLFAAGALRAVVWAKDQPAGFYTMADVLGLSD